MMQSSNVVVGLVYPNPLRTTETNRLGTNHPSELDSHANLSINHRLFIAIWWLQHSEVFSGEGCVLGDLRRVWYLGYKKSSVSI